MIHSISVKQLADCLKVRTELLYDISNNTEKFYKIYTIPKKNGKPRVIEAPVPILKYIQKIILKRFLSRRVHFIATAFEQGSSIQKNAWIHREQPVVLKLDLKNFFPSITYKRVLGYFKRQGYPENIAVLLSHLCTLNGHLPQGAVTSPRLSNFIQYNFDLNLYKYCYKNKLCVTRYADDITFSGNINKEVANKIIHYCEDRLSRINLQINKSKTKIIYSNQRQTVTGLVVNKKINTPITLRRQLRQTMYYLIKFGEINRTPPTKNDIYKLLGQISFVCETDRSNSEFYKYKKYLIDLQKTI